MRIRYSGEMFLCPCWWQFRCNRFRYSRDLSGSWWFDALLRFWWRRWLRPWSLTSGGSVFPSDLTFGSWDSELYHPPSRTLLGLLVTQIITDLRVVITGDLWIQPPPSRPAFGSFAMQVVMILHTSTTPDQSLVGIFSVVKFSVIDSPLKKRINKKKRKKNARIKQKKPIPSKKEYKNKTQKKWWKSQWEALPCFI